MSWGIAETASEIEKIKSESADYLSGLNSCGVIDWNTYNYAFDFYEDLLIKAYEQGKKDAQPEPCDDPRADVYYLAEKIGIHRLYALVVALRGEPEPQEDAVSRADVVDMLEMYPFTEYGEYETAREIVKRLPSVTLKPKPCEDAVRRKAAVEEIRRHGVGSFNFEDYTPEQAERFVIKLLQELPSVTPEICEDAVSRRILLNDLKKLIAAWEKYPVMAEQIKGVETAIGYVETIPSLAPKRNTGGSGYL